MPPPPPPGGGHTDSQVFLQVHKNRKQKHFKEGISCISLADNRLMDVTQLTLTWVGLPNGEKLASTSCKFDLDQSERKVSHCKSTQVHARPGQTESQVLLATPFGPAGL